MRFLGRAVFALAVLFCPWTLRAFDVSYGSLFQVVNISRPSGQAVLPLSRGKYANIRVLTRETLEWLNACPELCVQDAGDGSVIVEEFRAAQTRGGMWIADVSFDGKWLVTFLVFQNKNGYGVKPPEDFVFLDKKLRRLVEETLSERAAQSAEKNS